MERKTRKKTENSKLKVTYVRSVIGFDKRQAKILEALGFKKLNTTKIFPNNNSIKGSLFKIKHLVKVEEID